MRLIARPLLQALLLSILVPTASAETYSVGVESIDYYPLYAEKDGKYIGLAQEILDKFAQKAGHQFQYKPFPVIRLTKTYLTEKSLDFKFPDNEHWAKEEKQGISITYSNAIMDYTDGVMVQPKYLGMSVDRMKKLGIVRGFTPWDWMDLIGSGAVSVRETSNLESVIQQTLADRVDGAYFNIHVANYFMKNSMQLNNALVFDPGLPHSSDSYVLSTLTHPEVIQSFNRFLVDEADWISAIKKKYTEE